MGIRCRSAVIDSSELIFPASDGAPHFRGLQAVMSSSAQHELAVFAFALRPTEFRSEADPQRLGSQLSPERGMSKSYKTSHLAPVADRAFLKVPATSLGCPARGISQGSTL